MFDKVKGIKKEKWNFLLTFLLWGLYIINAGYLKSGTFYGSFMHLSIIDIIHYLFIACLIFFISLVLDKLFSRIFKGENSYYGYGSNQINLPKREFTCIAFVLFFLWLPYMVILYPGTMWWDCSGSILQCFGIIQLNNWNPIFQTFIMGGFIKLGNIFVDYNFGVFLYVLVQIMFASVIFSYAICFPYKYSRNKNILYLGTLLFGIIPVYPIYLVSMGKDSNWSCVILLMLVFTCEILGDKAWIIVKKNRIRYSIAFIAICLLRNAGIYVALSFLIINIFIVAKRERIYLFKIAGICIIFLLLWFDFLLPIFNVSSDGMSRDSWNIQFQQLARYINTYPEDIKDTDIDIINKMLDYNALKDKYNPGLVDSVTDVYFGDSISEEDLDKFIDLYIEMGRKHPVCYLDTIGAKSSGYFNPFEPLSVKPFTITGVADVAESLKNKGLNLNLYNIFDLQYFNLFVNVLQKIPIIRLITRSGIWVWAFFFLIFMGLKRMKSKKMCMVFIPGMVIIAGLLIVPANNYFRYVLSIAFQIPFLIVYTYGLDGQKQ